MHDRDDRTLQYQNALTHEERAALERGGFSLLAGPVDSDSDPVARTAAAYRALVEHSYRVPDVAHLLGVDGSRIRQRLARRSLYGIKPGRDWLLPSFQFTETGEVPSMAKVLPALDPALHPVEVVEWFTTPDPDLSIKGKAVSPRDWLWSGGPAQPVLALAAAL